MSKPPPHRLDIAPDAVLRDAINEWRRRQPDVPPAATAARRLVRRGLEADAEIARLRALLAAAGVNPDAKPEGGTP